jgi:hypothetical protein
VSPAEAGKFTQTKPVAPDKDIPVVMILSENGNQRTFFTRYEHGYHLSEIHDVLYNEPISDGDLLTWNNTISAWENQPSNSSETDPVFSSWAQTNSANYDVAYETVSSGGEIGGDLTVVGDVSAYNVAGENITSIENKIESIYSYLIQNFEHTYTATSTTIENFVSSEWTASLNLQPGDILLLSGANIAYILGESDGSGVDNYYPVNLKPNFIFFKAGIEDYNTLDTFPLSSTKSSKYVVQVEDTNTSDIFYGELNVVSNNTIATVTEFGTNYTTNEPFVEFGAEVNNQVVSLTAIGIDRDINNFVFKGNRINLF